MDQVPAIKIFGIINSYRIGQRSWTESFVQAFGIEQEQAGYQEYFEVHEQLEARCE